MDTESSEPKAERRNGVDSSATKSTGAKPSEETTKSDRRFSVQNFRGLVPAAAISAAAISLPILVGRKRRSNHRHSTDIFWRMLDDEEDSFVKHFTAENEREMRQKNIAASRCRQLSVDDSPTAQGFAHLHLLLCQGHESRTLNMILLDGSRR